MTVRAALADKTAKNKDIENALRVLKAEAEALRALADTLDDGFAQAVEAIHAMKQNSRGRLIVAGIGKSGHIARKIAATLASTGTPSFFVHPGEASHGDLGMVMQDDIVLLLSNSGESQELSDLIHYTRRFNMTLIAMTANKAGALAKHANIVLLLPPVAEACPNGLAPTTSTTMMLALGDALAVALLERMGLTPEQFRVFHPGGRLGAKLLSVADIMTGLEGLPLVTGGMTMDKALLVLTEKNLGCVLAVDEKNARLLKGIVTDGDLKRHMGPDLLKKTVGDIMSKNPKTISSAALAAEAVNLMTRTPGHYLTSLVVVDQAGGLAGLIRLQDCLRAGVA